MRRLAVIHTGGLGDFLQTFPVLAGARRRWTNLRVTIVGREEWMPLALAANLADEAFSADGCGLHRLFADAAVADDVPLPLRAADTILSFLPHPTLASHLRALTAAQVIEARSFPSPGEAAIPAAQFVYDQAAPALGLPAVTAVPRVQLTRRPPEATHGMVSLPWRDGHDTGVILAPGSGSRAKNWPLERFLELADRLAAAGRPTMWLLGPAELERREFARVPRERAMVNEPIVTVAAALSRASACVSNDSGVVHLSAALGRPTTVLFGPSDARVWAPRGDHVHVVRSATGEMSAIGVAEVMATLERGIAEQ